MPQRIFYRVGNGLFAVEETGGVTSVYDCGSTSRQLIVGAIDRAFPYFQGNYPGKHVDNLFISHYDRDHVNGIYHLLKNVEVDRVVLPMIPQLTRALNFASTQDLLLRDFILHPAEFISAVSPGTRTIFVDENDNADGELIQAQNIINLNTLQNGETISGSFQRCQLQDWLYIFFNPRCLNHRELDDFMNRLGLRRNASVQDIIDRLRHPGLRLKRILNHIFSPAEITKINDYSMVVWSGRGSDLRYGCLYTGDYNARLHLHELYPIFNRVTQTTDIIQIPHHGSVNNFNLGMCRSHCRHVISASKGPYRSHQIVNPHSVMDQITGAGFNLDTTLLGDAPL